MKLDLSMLVQELAVLPHTPVEHNEVSAYVLTHIFAPLREKHKVMFADLDFDNPEVVREMQAASFAGYPVRSQTKSSSG